MRLPDVNDLGARSTPDLRRQVVQDQSGEMLARGVGQLGEAVSHAEDITYQAQTRLAAAKALNAALDHQIAVQQTAQEVSDKVQRGELDYNTARQTFDDSVAKIKTPEIDNLDPVARETFGRKLQRNTYQGTKAIDRVVDFAQVKDYASQGDAALDKLDKLRQMAGTNVGSIANINSQAEAFVPLLRKGGLNAEQAAKKVQDFQDQSWFLQAQQRSMQSKDNMGAIRTLEKDLTTGFYVGKLDTDKRNAVLRSVINDRLVLENRAEHLADKREAQGQRALYQMDQQISTGVPATPAMWEGWQATTKGTSVEGEFADRQAQEAEVQGVLRKPIEQQMNFVQEKQASLEQGGGSVRDIANFARLSNAVKKNVAQMQDTPLVFNSVRTGQQANMLDLQALTSGDPAVAGEFASRWADISAMRKHYGDGVQMRLLYPQEAQLLVGALSSADSDPVKQAQFLGAVRTSMHDDSVFKAAMQQIAPDSPVKAYAGLLSAQERPLTIATHWFGKDDSVSSTGTSALLLRGEQLLSPTAAEKKADGKPRSALYLPPDADTQLQSDFTDKVKDAFAGRADVAQGALQAVRAYYVGRAEQLGRLASDHHDVESKIVDEAISATLGNVVNYNDRSPAIAPWGMDESTFNDRAQTALTSIAKARDMPPSAFSGVGLVNRTGNEYYLTNGRNHLLDKSGNPLTITIPQ